MVMPPNGTSSLCERVAFGFPSLPAPATSHSASSCLPCVFLLKDFRSRVSPPETGQGALLSNVEALPPSFPPSHYPVLPRPARSSFPLREGTLPLLLFCPSGHDSSLQ